jgi:hypothetical protein
MGLRQGALGDVGEQVMNSSSKTEPAPSGQPTTGVPLILLYGVADGPD